MNEAGILHYSRAISEVNRALSKIDWSQDKFNDAVLVAIIFLYIHGVRHSLEQSLQATRVYSTNG